MKVLSLKVTELLERKLAAVVKRRGVAKSDVVREALEHYLAQSHDAQPGSVVELAGDLVGCVKDGPKDLSSNPRHLSDFGK